MNLQQLQEKYAEDFPSLQFEPWDECPICDGEGETNKITYSGLNVPCVCTAVESRDTVQYAHEHLAELRLVIGLSVLTGANPFE